MHGGSDPFALDAVSGGHDALAALPPSAAEALTARVFRGLSPLCAAAELVRRGDLRTARVLVGAAAYLDAEDVGVLAVVPGGSDALAGLLLAPGLAPVVRTSAAAALAGAHPTAAALAALAETSDGPRRVQGAAASLAELTLRADPAVQDDAERLRSVGRQVRDKVRGTLRRQELQRAVASATLHPVVAWLAGDTDFLAAILPPVADAARETLLPHLLAAARGGDESLRSQVVGLLHRRWRDVAAAPLSCIVRTPWRGRDASLGPLFITALGTLGAVDELVSVVGASVSIGGMGGMGTVRLTALGELSRVSPKIRGEIDPALFTAALARCQSDPDPAVQALVATLAPQPGDGV